MVFVHPGMSSSLRLSDHALLLPEAQCLSMVNPGEILFPLRQHRSEENFGVAERRDFYSPR